MVTDLTLDTDSIKWYTLFGCAALLCLLDYTRGAAGVLSRTGIPGGKLEEVYSEHRHARIIGRDPGRLWSGSAGNSNACTATSPSREHPRAKYFRATRTHNGAAHTHRFQRRSGVPGPTDTAQSSHPHPGRS